MRGPGEPREGRCPRRRRGRRDHRVLPRESRARGHDPRGEGWAWPRGQRRQRRHRGAGALLRLGLAGRSPHAAPLPSRRGDRDPATPGGRPAPVCVGAPLPAGMHLGPGSAQHARQAPALPVQPAADGRAGGIRGHRLPRGPAGRALSLPRPRPPRRRHQEDGAAGAARAEAGDPRPRGGGEARPRLRAGPGQDRRGDPGSRRLERRLPPLHRAARRPVPGAARRHREARDPRHRAAGRWRPHRRGPDHRRPRHRGRLRAGPRRRQPRGGADGRREPAHLPGQGIFLDVSPALGRAGAYAFPGWTSSGSSAGRGSAIACG